MLYGGLRSGVSVVDGPVLKRFEGLAWDVVVLFGSGRFESGLVDGCWGQ